MTVTYKMIVVPLLALALLPGCGQLPGTRDFRDFSIFEYGELPFCCWQDRPLSVLHATILKVDDGHYIFSATVWDPALDDSRDMPERDLTDAEVERMLALFSAVQIVPGPFDPNLWFADMGSWYRWDDDSFRIPSPWPEMIVSDDDRSEILGFLGDLAEGS